jgi:hypothetical protein
MKKSQTKSASSPVNTLHDLGGIGKELFTSLCCGEDFIRGEPERFNVTYEPFRVNPERIRRILSKMKARVGR